MANCVDDFKRKPLNLGKKKNNMMQSISIKCLKHFVKKFQFKVSRADVDSIMTRVLGAEDKLRELNIN